MEDFEVVSSAQKETMSHEALIEKLMEHFASGGFSKEAERARREFNEWAGQFDENSNGFEMKLAQFTDWYLFVRPLEGWGEAPIQVGLKESGFPLESSWEEAYQGLVSSRHSLFTLVKIKGKDLHIRDIFSGYNLTVKNSSIVHGFNKGEIFEARLIPYGHNFLFSGSFCFHPPQAVKYILNEAKNVEKVALRGQRESRGFNS